MLQKKLGYAKTYNSKLFKYYLDQQVLIEYACASWAVICLVEKAVKYVNTK